MKRSAPLRRKKHPVRRSKLASKARKTVIPMKRLKKQLWEECKRIIRERYQRHDGTWNCYTCGAHLGEPQKAQTGHFIPSSVCSVEMRYDLDNLRVQCYRCNINLSGNWPEYEKHLKVEKGDDFPTKLKERNESTKGAQYDREWYRTYIANYRQI